MMPASSQLTVIVVAYGPAEPLKVCLGSIGRSHPVVVVDNGGSADTRQVVEAAGATYVDAGRNLGFAAGVNLALEVRPGSGDVLLVNPDATVDPGCIEALRHALEGDQGLACVAPRLLNTNGDREVQGSWPLPSPRWMLLDAFGLARYVREPQFLIGAVLLISSRALDEIGPFDERFFLYAEEADWQRRALDRGWRVRVVPEAVARHTGRGTGGDPRWREAAFQASVERYIRKWHGPWGWFSFRVGGSLAATRRMVQGDARRRSAARNRLSLYLRGPERVAYALGVPLSPVSSDTATPS